MQVHVLTLIALEFLPTVVEVPVGEPLAVPLVAYAQGKGVCEVVYAQGKGVCVVV